MLVKFNNVSMEGLKFGTLGDDDMQLQPAGGGGGGNIQKGEDKGLEEVRIKEFKDKEYKKLYLYSPKIGNTNTNATT
jgi:hypothetical protein